MCVRARVSALPHISIIVFENSLWSVAAACSSFQRAIALSAAEHHSYLKSMTHANTDTSSCHRLTTFNISYRGERERESRQNKKRIKPNEVNDAKETRLWNCRHTHNDWRAIAIRIASHTWSIIFRFVLFGLFFCVYFGRCVRQLENRTIYFIQFLWYDVYLSSGEFSYSSFGWWLLLRQYVLPSMISTWIIFAIPLLYVCAISPCVNNENHDVEDDKNKSWFKTKDIHIYDGTSNVNRGAARAHCLSLRNVINKKFFTTMRLSGQPVAAAAAQWVCLPVMEIFGERMPFVRRTFHIFAVPHSCARHENSPRSPHQRIHSIEDVEKSNKRNILKLYKCSVDFILLFVELFLKLSAHWNRCKICK